MFVKYLKKKYFVFKSFNEHSSLFGGKGGGGKELVV